MAVRTLLQSWLFKRAVTDAIDSYVGERNEPVIDTRDAKLRLRVADGSTPGGIIVGEPPVLGVKTPHIVYPPNGTSGIIESPIIEASPFEAVDTHLDKIIHRYTYWQVARDETFTDLLYDSGWSPANLTRVDLANLGITVEPSVTLYIRVKYKTHYGSESSWSPVSSFSGDIPIPESQTAILNYSQARGGDIFGRAVAISETNRIAVSIPNYTGADKRSGGVVIFDLINGQWTETALVEKDTTIDWSYIGYSLAVSRNGKVILAGGKNGVLNAIMLSEEVDGVWIERTFDYPAEYNPNHAYGQGVALSQDGTWMAIGAPLSNVNGTNSGTAFLFQRNGNHWTLVHTFTQPDASSTDYFGWSIAMSDNGGVIAISARGASTQSSSNAGAAYVYRNNNGVVTFDQKLEALDAARSDYFGCTISINGEGTRIAVGSFRDDDYGGDTGACYIFDYDGSNWSQSVKLIADDARKGDRFGFSVSLSPDGKFLASGAYRDDDAKTDTGSVYLFAEVNGTWAQINKFNHSNPGKSDRFGYSVALSGNGILVGGAYSNDALGNNAGSAYVFS